MMERFDLPEDQPIEFGFVTKAVAEAQAKVEGANFDIRKHLLEYDDVLNKQRAAIYRRRQEIMGMLNKEELAQFIRRRGDGALGGCVAAACCAALLDMHDAVAERRDRPMPRDDEGKNQKVLKDAAIIKG